MFVVKLRELEVCVQEGEMKAFTHFLCSQLLNIPWTYN